LIASIIPAAVQRSAIAAFRHRYAGRRLRGGHPQRQTLKALQGAVLLADLRRARGSLRLQGMDKPRRLRA